MMRNSLWSMLDGPLVLNFVILCVRMVLNFVILCVRMVLNFVILCVRMESCVCE